MRGRGLTRRQFVRLCVAGALAPAMWSLSGCARSEPDEVQTTVFAFDTVCVLGGAMARPVLDEAAELCGRFEQLFSRTIATSDVGRINAAGGEAVEVDPQTAQLVQAALGYCEASGGLFDITIGAVSELWDFGEGVVPAEEAVREALPHVGWERVETSGNVVRLLDPLARLDLGGIAKGYIADRLVELFVERGVTSAFVNLGGNVKVLGTKTDGSPWSVGVRDPFAEDGEAVVARVRCTDASLVTSGLYERSFTRDGRRYWHILDPRTGYPVETDVVSASVFSAASVDGDGYTKPLFMMGRDEALRFAESHGVHALLIEGDGTSHATSDAPFEPL